MPAHRIIVRRAGKVVETIEVPGGIVTFGRHPSNTVVLDTARASRYHAAVSFLPGARSELQDLGSRNGTEMRGLRVVRAALADGDRFTIADHEISLERSEADDASDLRTEASSERDASEPVDSQTRHLFIGRSPPARALLKLVQRAAATRVAVLVRGESGSGKGVVARLLHDWSDRQDRPFVEVNCAAIPTELVESELFGHRKGAFTGALSDQAGKFRAADRGTLFLDEVGDLSAAAQAKILRAIEGGIIEPLGEARPVSVDVRVIAATHLDLDKAIADGAFREDLYFRLATATIEVPPLRERPDDVVLLANFLLADLADDIPAGRGSTFTPAALEKLAAHDWPGNVRELRNAIAQSLLAKDGAAIEASDLSLRGAEAKPGTPLDKAQAREIRAALARHGGNRTKAAAELGVTRKTLGRRMERFGIESG